MLKLDIGGGARPRPGFTNVDILECADVRLDLEEVGRGRAVFPYDDDTVDEVYSSHCFEHVDPYNGVITEIARICKLDARVEIRVPHWNHPMARCAGHKHCLSEEQVGHWRIFKDSWWPKGTKWFSEPKISYVPTQAYHEAARLFPFLSPEQVYRYVPGTCHEIQFVFRVESK